MGTVKIISGKIDTRGTDNWHMIINAGYDDNGKRNRISVSTGLPEKNNQRKAQAMLSDTIRQFEECREITGITDLRELNKMLKEHDVEYYRNKSENPDSTMLLFTDVVQEWLRNVQATTSTNNSEKYGYAIKHIEKYFKGMYVQDIAARHIEDYYITKLLGDAEHDIKPLARKTLLDHKAVIEGAFKRAIKFHKAITDNPTEDVPFPKKPEGENALSFFTKEELNVVLDKIKGHYLESAVVIAANYGLRRQEILGLRWSAIDLEAKKFTVNHTITAVKGKAKADDSVKTTCSRRTFPLTDEMTEYLLNLKAEQESMKAICGDAYSNNDYVCKYLDGTRYHPNTVDSAWKIFLAKNGLTHITFHDLRHSCASLLVNLGFSLIEIKDWLGHADIKSTMIYAHLYEGNKERITSKVSGALVIPKKAENLNAEPESA